MKKIKIAHVLGALNSGGAEKIILDLLEKIDKNKFDTALIFWKRGPFYEDFKKITGLKLIELKSPGNNIFKKSLSFIRLIFDLKKEQKRNNFDVMHVHLPPLNIPVSLQKVFNKKLKLVYTAHSVNIYEEFFTPYIHIKFNKTFDQITSCSKKVQDYVEKKQKIKVQTIYNGVKTKEIQQIKKKKNEFINEKNFNIVSVGRLTEEKGFDKLINNFKLIKAEIPEAKLYICGDGHLRPNLEKLIKDLKLEKDVKLLGIRKDVYSIMKNCDLFMLLSNWEGLGIVFIEAMACKLPVIGSDVDGIKEVIEHNNNGYLVKNTDEKTITKLVKKYYEDENLRKMHGEKGLEIAKKNFDINKITKEYEEMYVKVLR